MNMKKITLAALAGATLLAAAPAFADGYRGERHNYRGSQFQNHRGEQFQNQYRGDRFQRRAVIVNNHGPRFYGYRRVVVQRPVFVERPVVVQRPAYDYNGYPSHNVIGGLILGTVIGAAIANHAGY